MEFQEVYHAMSPESVTETVLLEKRLLEQALSDWHNMPSIGSSYSQQVQKDVCTFHFY